MSRRAAILLLSAAAALAADSTMPPPPPTAVHDVTETLHGHTITDPYRWLEDQNSPATRAWIDAQIKYTNSILARIPGREALRGEIERFMRTDSTLEVVERGGNYFFMRRRPDQDQAVLYFRKGRNGADHVIVDPLQLAPDHSMSVTLADVSWDGRLVAYFLRRGGEDETTLHVYDTATGKQFADSLPKLFYVTVALKPDHSGFYYSYLRDGESPLVRYHALGRDGSGDREIFGSKLSASDEVDVQLSDTGRYLLVDVAHGSAGDKTDVWFQDLAGGG